MGHVRTREPAIVNSKKEDVCTQWNELLFGNIHPQGNIINEVGMSLRLERRRDQAQKEQGDQNQFFCGGHEVSRRGGLLFLGMWPQWFFRLFGSGSKKQRGQGGPEKGARQNI